MTAKIYLFAAASHGSDPQQATTPGAQATTSPGHDALRGPIDDDECIPLAFWTVIFAAVGLGIGFWLIDLAWVAFVEWMHD